MQNAYGRNVNQKPTDLLGCAFVKTAPCTEEDLEGVVFLTDEEWDHVFYRTLSTGDLVFLVFEGEYTLFKCLF